MVLGRYRLVRRLGAGGMATVYLAEDERLRRPVAIKRLHADSPEAMALRLEREARVGASLNHPNIVAVYDTDTDDHGVVIVMEYVAGETLAAALRRGPLDPARALEVVGDVASALDHAHRAGVVHRDVKPANVLLGDVVKLADLGIAHAAEQTHLTATGTVLGTASYMAPEQLEGRPVGPAADTYALAAVAYETLSGRRAREGATPVEVAHRVTSEPPPDLRRAWPAAPAAAAEALARGMARDPDARQGSPGEMARELSEAIEGGLLAPAAASTEPIERGEHDGPPLPPPGDPTIHRARADRRRSLLGRAAAALAMLVAVAVIVALVAGGGGGADEAGPPEESAAAGAEQDGSDAASQEGAGGAEPAPAPEASETPLFATDGEGDPARGAALNEQGHSLIQSGQPEQAVPILQQAVQSFPEDTDDIQYAYALYNLGHALRLVGRPEEAIPVLERRLEIPNQTDVVEAELARARAEAE
jgi:serine/threonine-protein kinase